MRRPTAPGLPLLARRRPEHPLDGIHARRREILVCAPLAPTSRTAGARRALVRRVALRCATVQARLLANAVRKTRRNRQADKRGARRAGRRWAVAPRSSGANPRGEPRGPLPGAAIPGVVTRPPRCLRRSRSTPGSTAARRAVPQHAPWSRSSLARRTVRLTRTAAPPPGERHAPRVPQRPHPANGTHRVYRSGTGDDPRRGSRVPQRYRRANGSHRLYRSGTVRRTVRIACTAAVPPGERFASLAPQRYRPANGSHRESLRRPRAPRRSRSPPCGFHRSHRNGPARRTVLLACTAAVPRRVQHAPRALQRYDAANRTHRVHCNGTARRAVRTACTAAGRPPRSTSGCWAGGPDAT